MIRFKLDSDQIFAIYIQQISFQFFMLSPIPKSGSSGYHITEIWRHICRIGEIHLWRTRWLRMCKIRYIILGVPISFVLYYHIVKYYTCLHNISDFYLIPNKSWMFNNSKSSLKTPKARSTSLRQASWFVANKEVFHLVEVN